MFTKEVEDEERVLKERWQKKCSEMVGEHMPRITNRSGIYLKPAYGSGDIRELDYKDIGLPGEFPFTRGNHPLHYQVMPYMMMQGYGFETTEETRKRMDLLSKLGSRMRIGKEEEPTVYVGAMDLPTQRGIDPDEPAARGRVGACGVSISTVDDFIPLFEGLPFEKVLTVLIGIDAAIVLNALYAAYILEVRKEPLEKMFLISCSIYHSHQWYWDTIAFPPRAGLKLGTENAKFIVENCPLSYHSEVDGYNQGEAGGTPVQEVAFALAATSALTEECIKAGLDVDKVVSKFVGHPHIGLGFFEEIAKFLAWRRLWAKMFKEKFGCKDPDALMFKVIASQTGGSELPAQEPLNNIIRCTIMGMAGMLSDLEGCWISAYDEALGIPTEEAVQVCVRTYQILGEETDIPKVTDPLAGSYYIEWLTTKMEEEIVKLMGKIENMGGYLKCVESGWLRAEIEKSAYERFQRLDRGEDVKVGVNKYKVEEVSEAKAFRPRPEAEIKAVERIKKYREKRDNVKTEASLVRVREAAIKIDKKWPESCGVLMPALIEAARAGATLGEMHRILREVFGWGYFAG